MLAALHDANGNLGVISTQAHYYYRAAKKSTPMLRLAECITMLRERPPMQLLCQSTARRNLRARLGPYKLALLAAHSAHR